MAFGDRWKKKKEVKEQPYIHAYVATPAYDGKVHTDFAVSLAESCMMATAAGIRVTASVMGNGAFIDLARCNFVRLFLETDCTHLFFIDSDLKWEPRAFVGLLTAGRPVCAGVYRRRQEPETYPVRYEEDERGGIQIEEGGWIKCERVPTGFLCIERKVIEEMSESALKIRQHGQPDVPQLFYTKITEDRAFMGEDFCWCDDYTARYKQPIWVWADFDMIHGGFRGNWWEYIDRTVKEQEALEAEKEKSGG